MRGDRKFEIGKKKKRKDDQLNRRYVLDSDKLEGHLSLRSLQVGSDIGYSVIPLVLICSVHTVYASARSESCIRGSIASAEVR